MLLATFVASELWCTTRLAQADELDVPGEYDTIQAAVDAAADGDTIIVAPGTYIENLDFLGKAITLQSTNGAAETTISGEAETLGGEFPDTVTFANAEDSESVLQGFTITFASRSGVYCFASSPTIIDNVIQENTSDGVRLQDSSPVFERNVVRWHSGFITTGISALGSYDLVLRDCEVRGNYSEFGGSGAFLGPSVVSPSTATLDRCVFAENTTDTLGGVVVTGISTVMTDCVFEGNVVGQYGPAGVTIDADAVFVRCIFANNSGDFGGAVSCRELSPTTFVESVFVGNSALSRGGAFNVDPAPSSGTDTEIVVDRCTFLDNTAPLGSVASQGTESVSAESTVVFRNCIVWGHEAPLFEESDGTITVEYSDVEGGYAGEGNIDEDPLFVDAVGGDLHLTDESPCIDAGDPAAPLDPDGTTVDMGAYFHVQFGFLRGDVSGGGDVNALLDAIALLAWQFGAGAEPSCMDAADADDNGEVHALIDALYLLTWGFMGGTAPPDPGPTTCGVDITEDETECATPFACP